jgi:hypothetical protein
MQCGISVICFMKYYTALDTKHLVVLYQCLHSLQMVQLYAQVTAVSCHAVNETVFLELQNG